RPARRGALPDLTPHLSGGLLHTSEHTMQRTRIIGTGTYLPERVVTNDDLSQKMGIETTDSWIRERTGIGSRRIAAPSEATSDMAAGASRMALKQAGLKPEEVELIICG